MRAVVITRPGGPEVLELRDDVAAPEPGPRDVLVRVAATALNRADLLQRRGHYPAPAGWPRDIPGLEFAGTVERAGADAQRWQPDDRVMGLVGGGGYAEYVAVHEEELLPVPQSLTMHQAAAIPEAYLTAHDALFTQAHLADGDWLLVHAIASGVGIAALQLAHAFGARVIGTSRTGDKLERLRELGLEHAIATQSAEFADEVERITDGAGVDVVLDLVGGPYLTDDIRALAPRGRLVIVGLVAGRTAELDMGTVLRKRLHLIGTAMRSRAPSEKAAVTRAFQHHALHYFDDGTLNPVIDEVLPLHEAARAHEQMERNANVGKIVLTL